MAFIDNLNKITKFFKKKDKLQNKIYFSISSEGYGHSTRAISIAKKLKPDEYVIGTYGYALERLKKQGLTCIKAPRELELVGHDGAFDVTKTIIKNQISLINANKLIDEEVEIIKKTGASCVVADGRMVPVMAAEKLKLPCINITNQSAFYPFFEKDNWLVRLLGIPFDAWMQMYLSSTEEILIPDFEPPHTICLYNLSKNKKIMKRTRFVGPLVNIDADAIENLPKEKGKTYVVVSLGGHSYRRPIFDNLLKTAKKLPECEFYVFTFFEADNIPQNVHVMGMLADISSYLKTADLVVAQAGHSTAMEILALGKPSIIIPDRNQIEQENNAKKMGELKVAEIITHDELTEEKLYQSIQKVMKNEKYKQNAQFFATMYKGVDSRKKVSEILKDYAMRLHRY